ncbi:MAG: helicase C-terminal domain-containing protein [Rectinema sp.]
MLPSQNKTARTQASTRFTPEAILTLAGEIEGAGGNEVFAVCRTDGDGKISSVEVVARGSKSAVPALSSHFDRGDVIVHNHPSGTLNPSDADVEIAAQAGSAGVGSYIVDNAVSHVFVVAEPARKRAYRPVNVLEIEGVLDSGGKLGRLMEHFEPRPSQVQMAGDVAATLNDGGVMVAEAGTGVGKSFAYLVPAFAWALRNDERIVVSTATINLQKQLIDKDIPVVASLFRKPVKAVLVKGRGNYLCKVRLSEALDEEGLLADADHPLRRIAAWDESGSSGDRADLPFWPEDQVWNRICSEAESCLGLRCFHREECHLLSVRKAAADAQIVVANHHILFADLASRLRGAGYEQTAVLPAYRALVLDEAHAIESSATSLFSESLSKFSVYRRLARIRRKNRGREFGVAIRLLALPGFSSRRFDGLDRALSEARAAVADFEREALGLFGKERTVRLALRDPDNERRISGPAGALERALLAVSGILGDALDDCPDSLAQESAYFEAKASQRKLGELASLCAKFKEFDAHAETVFWLEKSRLSSGEIFVDFVASPLDIAATMRDAVFGKMRSSICTSATLSVGGSFDFWMNRTGLDRKREDLAARSYPSPFPFRTNALLAVDRGAPAPDNPDSRAYINRAVLRLIKASRGRALVLFTSYEALLSAYETAKPEMEALGIVCMRQGMDDRSRLLAAFRDDISSVLFATDSFWEGVDAPGETLSLVIICKLPFRVPTDPVQMARAEALEKRGGNSFMEISLPEAVIRFKQGFGRLIRHSEDRGAVVVLDPRLVTKRYGPVFVESLPECRLLVDGLDVIEREVGRFLDA